MFDNEKIRGTFLCIQMFLCIRRYGSKTFDIFFTAGIINPGIDKKLLSPAVDRYDDRTEGFPQIGKGVFCFWRNDRVQDSFYLSIEGTAATVRVTLEDWHGIAFTDFHSLLKIDGEWKIIAKVFHQY